MLNEYAVEPSLLNSWTNFRYLTEKFGVSYGRFISRYPRAWKRMVFESLGACPPVERKRIEVRLQQLDDRMLPRQACYDGTLGWLDNAETEHSVNPFHAIIAGSNPRNHLCVLDGHGFDETERLWQCPEPGKVRRKATDMANAICPLLLCCSEVVFIDPHFGPEVPRFRRPFEAFMALLASPIHRRPIMRIEYHTGSKATATFFQAEAQQRLRGLIPVGLTVRLVRWRQAELHNRFILTNIGGLLIGKGLDEDDGAGPPQDDFVRLDEATWRARWADYVAKPAFTFVDDVTIVGTKLL